MKLASFEAIARALEDANARYLVAGGLAVNAHGYLRFTKDVDWDGGERRRSTLAASPTLPRALRAQGRERG